MAITPYDRITNLQNDQALAPTDPYPAPKLDQEYNALKVTTDDIIQHLDIIQRDDGQLENGSVGRDQLSDEVLIGFGAPEQWQPDHDYAGGDTVFEGSAFWYCEVNHTSTVFADDLAAGYWTMIANLSEAVTGAARMLVSDTPPSSPSHGHQWFDSSSGASYVWYDDGSTAQWVQLNGNATAGEKSSFITPQRFGAVGNGGVNDTAALQAAINYCNANNRGLYIPAGRYLFDVTLVIKRGIRIWGESQLDTVLVYAGLGVALIVAPDGSYGNDNVQYSFSDFSLVHSTPNGGSYGVQLLANTGHFIAHWVFERVHIGEFLNAGFLISNASVDGVFLGTIHRCYIANGIIGINIGDSITISSTQIHAQGNHIGINVTQVSGARQFTIQDCNITCQGGGIYLENTTGVNILNTWVEHPSYYGNHMGSMGGQIHLQGAKHTKIQGCTVQPLAGAVVTTTVALYVSGTAHNNVIGENEWGTGASGAHIEVAPGAIGNKIESGQRDIAGAAVLVLNGSLTTENAESGWISYTPAVSAAAGAAPPSATAGGRYRVEGKTVFLELEITVNTNGIAAGALITSLPFPALGNIMLSGWRLFPGGFGVTGRAASGTLLQIQKTTDGAYPAVDGSAFILGGVYQRQ